LKLKKVIKFYKECYKHKIIEFHKEDATLKNGLRIAHIEFQEIKHDNEYHQRVGKLKTKLFNGLKR
jgi:deoxycytidine triphosphate deaminase